MFSLGEVGAAWIPPTPLKRGARCFMFSLGEVRAAWIPPTPLKRGARCFMFSLGEVRATYTMMDGVSAREERKNYSFNGG
ncbi:hypothetical protein CENA302_00880 [Cylindrospermopsis raciborskii CENA302]|uniref:Uncharacterized protein n=1 Tax=Cylindrospermopsis raciborskii CENA302 TaxID=1170768 RepID=A0A9Q5WBD4_9CYAN|nr:hypothetical protein BCV64_03010 [Cylindrospermopsis raciborskii MVCC14]OPH11305.1 hypothetical protein CENA302_00880 [Cylindrospermopsis raciborskii CENA302]